MSNSHSKSKYLKRSTLCSQCCHRHYFTNTQQKTFSPFLSEAVAIRWTVSTGSLERASVITWPAEEESRSDIVRNQQICTTPFEQLAQGGRDIRLTILLLKTVAQFCKLVQRPTSCASHQCNN